MSYYRPNVIEEAVPMNHAQKHLHDVLASELRRDFGDSLEVCSARALGAFSRRVTQLIKLASNPLLLARDETLCHDALLGEVIAEGQSPKIVAACSRARRFAKLGRRSIVWTAFAANVESIAEHLAELNPAVIGVRELKRHRLDEELSRFRDDRSCMVMVASAQVARTCSDPPANCTDSIYVDRTYDLVPYLYSLRWMAGRSGPSEGCATVHLLICPESIDENIRTRLDAKMAASR